MDRRSWANYWPDILMNLAAVGAIYYIISKGISQLQGAEEAEQLERKQAAAAAAAALRRLDKSEDDESAEEVEDRRLNGMPKSKRRRKEDLVLNRYEQAIALDVVAPDDIAVSFSDIGGLADIVEELKESVIYPLIMPELYSQSSALLRAPPGVLLYGPPGCGKTMLAKALARESGATFINLHISSVTEKWFGDSNKLVTAVFSLARKLQPSIVFIDEIDAVLGRRREGEHEASGQVKAEFMTHWDGLLSADADGRAQSIVVLGATNRIDCIDEAILRRLPKKFSVPLPSTSQRRRLFEVMLKGTKLDQDDLDLGFLARVSAGMSGSDIREACRDAAMIPMREIFRQKRASGSRTEQVGPDDVRGVRTSDFFEAAGGVKIPKPRLSDQSATANGKPLQADIDEDEDLIA